LFYWRKKARKEGLTAIEAACLAFDFEPLQPEWEYRQQFPVNILTI